MPARCAALQSMSSRKPTRPTYQRVVSERASVFGSVSGCGFEFDGGSVFGVEGVGGVMLSEFDVETRLKTRRRKKMVRSEKETVKEKEIQRGNRAGR